MKKMYKSFNFCYIWILMVGVVPVSFCDNHNYPIWTIDLLNQPPQNTTSSPPTELEQKSYVIDVININSNVSFFVIQAHSFIENITLSFDNSLDTNSDITGTNIGLVWTGPMDNRMRNKSVNSDTVRLYIIRQAPVFKKVWVLLAITTYGKDDPVPGGCNYDYETMIAPYQKVIYDETIITVMSQPPSRNEEFCSQDNIATDMYYMYLNENDNDPKEYFWGIQKMMTVEGIVKYGTRVPAGLGASKFKQMYNSYRGTGRVFGAVATLNGRSSAYVSAVSFGCNLTNWNAECIGPNGVQWKLICAFLLIMGAFICFRGHTNFKAGLFTMGFMFGSIVTVLVVSIDNYFPTEGQVMCSLAIGIFFGFLWAFLWWKYGAPLMSVQLTFLLAGTLISSGILYNNLGHQLFLTSDIFFWLIFTIIVIITLIPIPIIFLYPSLHHIVCLSLLGSYAFVVALNYYIGGNLPYIIINTYRRIAVKNFGQAVVDPPYQLMDISQTILWAILFGLGVFIQYRHSIGKAPFPPHRPGIDLGHLEDLREPLLPEIPTMESSSTYGSTAPVSEWASVYPSLKDVETASSSYRTASDMKEIPPYHSNRTPPPPYQA